MTMTKARKITMANLPAAAAKLIVRNRKIMSSWNDDVRKLLEERGAKLVAECAANTYMTSSTPIPESIIGYDYRRFELDTPAGKLTISPSGNWLACRFDDPDRAKAFLGDSRLLRTWMNWDNLNPYSGKWNFYYCGQNYQMALDAVREVLDGVTARKEDK